MTIQQRCGLSSRSLRSMIWCAMGLCIAGMAGTVSGQDLQGRVDAGKTPDSSRSLFLVFDVSMERLALKDVDANAPAQDVLQRGFAGLVPWLRAWGERHGVRVEAALFADRRKIDLGQKTFSHLIVEKIIQEARADGAGGPTFSGRKWAAQAFDLRGGADKLPSKLGSQEVVSDGMACFDGKRVPVDTNCQREYLRTLTRHLQWIDPSWGPLGDGP